MTSRTFVTGFLPFGSLPVNPTALLARGCGRCHRVIEVSFAAVEALVDELGAESAAFDGLLMLGLRGRGTAVEVERLARNHVGPDPDVRGVVRGPGPIEPGAPETLRGTLFATPPPMTTGSGDAGCYLCNYLFYRALLRFPGKRVGFVHVPPLDVMPLERQRRHLDELLRRIE